VSLPEHYADQLYLLDEVLRAEVRQWPFGATARLGDGVTGMVARAGERLRPVTALCFAEMYGVSFYRTGRGGLDRVVAPAAAVELYHLSVLADDDRVAATLRSLAYHPIHRSALLDEAEKLAVHRELDEAATLLSLGHAVDSGWHEGWYPSYLDYPYEQLLAWTGSLFGCAAAMGARVAGAPDNAVEDARQQGVALGALYQFVDEYLDVFGAAERPYEDFRAGRLSGPVVHLLRTLHATGRDRAAESVVRRLADEARTVGDVGWLLALMRACNVEEALRSELAARAAPLAGSGLEELVSLVLGGYPWR
jgi:geranylgeranyl pyrophosphate synthase